MEHFCDSNFALIISLICQIFVCHFTGCCLIPLGLTIARDMAHKCLENFLLILYWLSFSLDKTSLTALNERFSPFWSQSFSFTLNQLLERFSNDFRKTKTKGITPTNHNRSRQRNELITFPSNYNRNHVITLDIHLKTALLSEYVSCLEISFILLPGGWKLCLEHPGPQGAGWVTLECKVWMPGIFAAGCVPEFFCAFVL